jgi:hypothetical protein
MVSPAAWSCQQVDYSGGVGIYGVACSVELPAGGLFSEGWECLVSSVEYLMDLEPDGHPAASWHAVPLFETVLDGQRAGTACHPWFTRLPSERSYILRLTLAITKCTAAGCSDPQFNELSAA